MMIWDSRITNIIDFIIILLFSDFIEYYVTDMAKPNILHIAPLNYAGLPYLFMETERKQGYDSHLVTLFRNPFGYQEDITLNLPFLNDLPRRMISPIVSRTVSNKRLGLDDPPLIWKPSNQIQSLLLNSRDNLWEKIIKRSGVLDILKKSDILVLDGGLGFLRSGKYVLEWAGSRDRLVTFYYGSDLRTRGVIEPIDQAAKLVFVAEFDHIYLHPRAIHVPFPFEAHNYDHYIGNNIGNLKTRIGHSPTNRQAKGSDVIIKAMKELEEKYDTESVLIEHLPYQEALMLKSSCNIFIDQIGELGYGISGLEALAMGIPTAVTILPDYQKFLGDNPFINISRKDIYSRLETLIQSECELEQLSFSGREWVRNQHDPERCLNLVLEQYQKSGWID
ncbi:glycosyltransferase [bacterium]|nr:glycosyltransferase [bacterium]